MIAIGVDTALAEGDWNYCVHSMECWIETMIKDQGSESGSRSMIRIKSKTSLLSVWNYCVPAAECWIETMERRSAESVKSRRENCRAPQY